MPFFDEPDWGDDLGEEKRRHGTVTAFPHFVRRSRIPYLRGKKMEKEDMNILRKIKEIILSTE